MLITADNRTQRNNLHIYIQLYKDYTVSTQQLLAHVMKYDNYCAKQFQGSILFALGTNAVLSFECHQNESINDILVKVKR